MTAPATERIGELTIDPRGVKVLAAALTRGTPVEQLTLGFREAIQNATDAHRLSGVTRPIEISTAGSDVVVRDHGPGLTADEIHSLILNLFASGKSEGLGGFGAGSLSMLMGSENVIIRSRANGHPGVRFERAWVGERAPIAMSEAEAEAFGTGTEVCFSNATCNGWNERQVSQYQLPRMMDRVLASSQFPAGVTMTLDGQSVETKWALEETDRRRGPMFREDYPGVRVEHYMVPAQKGQEVAVVQLGDPEVGDCGMSQFERHAPGGCGVAYIVRLFPTVRPGDVHYPFTFDRMGLTNSVVERDISMVLLRLRTERIGFEAEQEWHARYYLPTDEFPELLDEEARVEPPRAETDDRVGDAVEDTPSTEERRAAAAPIVTTLATEADMVRQLLARAESAATPEVLVSERDAAKRMRSDVVRAGLGGGAGLVVHRASFRRPVWLPADVDVGDPSHVEQFEPLVTAVRHVAGIMADEAQHAQPLAPLGEKRVLFGLLFDHETHAQCRTGLSVPGLPADGNRAAILFNPTSDAWRAARSREAMADAVCSVLAHEVAHLIEPNHSESFSVVRETLGLAMVNRRDEMQAIFNASGAFEALRRIHALPPQAPVPSFEAPTAVVCEEARWNHDLGALGPGRRLTEILEAAMLEAGPKATRLAGSFAETLQTLEASGTVDRDTAERVIRFAAEFGIPAAPVPRGAPHGAARTLQMQVVDSEGLRAHAERAQTAFASRVFADSALSEMQRDASAALREEHASGLSPMHLVRLGAHLALLDCGNDPEQDQIERVEAGQDAFRSLLPKNGWAPLSRAVGERVAARALWLTERGGPLVDELVPALTDYWAKGHFPERSVAKLATITPRPWQAPRVPRR